MANKKLLIIGHVPSMNTQVLRDAVVRGAMHVDITDVDILTMSPFEAQPDDVLTSDGIILGTTENLGYMSGALKDFFDRCYYPVLEEKQGLPVSVYIRAGFDGTGTKRAIETILTGLRWKLVQPPLICQGAWDEKFITNCEEFGMTMAAGLDAGIY